jgi:hypothetical protein
VTDALTFSALWTAAFGLLFALPLSVAIAYSVLRGGPSPAERRLRELYRVVLEQELHGEQCFVCREEVEPDWRTCPACLTALRGRCRNCEATVKLHWSTCPHCAEALDRLPTPVPQGA